ncbi:MAG: ATPase, P-type (Transporting), HAD superfamily, subfamily IC [candidate division CPR1 bacterium GW2011_GWA2_42_17]|uniref:ATPase, P-type (Transporting), HAD superfamily, subfamily IC n=1 Tax=candidate division CPR1 bacterium GW2011_GWA2_42_17 TaxID=1618341 RepID=A0A0G0Z5N5_9BACT|nr:MAG: ATPase, P-type (Transporting), HAD superfamily, subfamily IC [candidate division CPR1 bacterium GW2011_GWA2_42_17]
MEKVLGLTGFEAQKLLVQFGPNQIVDRPRQTRLQIFLSQFTNILIVLLTAAAIASLFLGDILDGVFILLIVILNGFLGFIQEYKAEKAIAALKKMTVSNARVIRDGLEQKVESQFLVPGDIVILQEGDQIPADCQLLESLHLEANEASLTGESMPVEKNPQDEIKRQLFLGTIVAKGRGKAQVISTGMQTRFGQIAASLSQIKEEKTPLQKKLSTLGKQLGVLALGASSTVFIIGLFSKYSVIEMILTSISLAVAAVPEGLPAVITIALAIGMQRMASKRAILRRLASLEALGATTIIATDKTGTLTKNEMRVVKIWGDLDRILTAGVICNNASLVFKHDSQKYDVLGDTTEAALLLLAVEKGLLPEQVKDNGTLLEEFAFDPGLKLMSVVWEKNKQKIVYTKGAPESILERSNLIQEEKQNIKTAFQEYAKEGLRVIALAYKNVERTPDTREDAEKDLVFIGFVGIADPARAEVKEAIALAERAGIRTIMITGDNELTANSIAEKIGLIQKGEEILTGKQFEQLSDDEATERLPHVRIFARTTPDHKLRIVRLLQKMGQVVAVTGDGVNDVLALKQADVGVAMGITGTDVAKQASDMIITDDNYATLVTAIEEGRTIFDNIKSAIKYLVGCNIGEVLAVVIAMLLGWPLILTPLQLLYVNLITDGLPAIVLAVTPKSEGIMKQKPRLSKNIFDQLDGIWFLEVSILTTIAALAAFYLGMQSRNLLLAQTLTFTTIILVQHFILLDVRAKNNSFWQKKIFTDKIFLLAFFAPLALQLLLIYNPYLSGIFKITAVSFTHLLLIIVLSTILLASSEIRKIVLRIRKTYHAI